MENPIAKKEIEYIFIALVDKAANSSFPLEKMWENGLAVK